MKKEKVIKGVALLIAMVFVVILGISVTAIVRLHSMEVSLGRRQNNSTRAFYMAEAGIQKALWVINNNQGHISDNSWLTNQVNTDNNLGKGSFQVQITGDSVTKTIVSEGEVSSVERNIQVQVHSWLSKIPGAVYSKGGVKIKFDKRDDAYIDGGDMPGIYSTDEVKSKREGEGRVDGNPPILENQEVPVGLRHGIWDAFDINALRKVAKANGTYFSADETDDEYNNPYNKKGKYTLPVVRDDETKITEGVFFFDARNGEPLDDDEVNPKNEIRVKLEGTTEKVSGVIVVVGDLHIKDTNNYDFLFDGIILVLDDLKIDDKKTHRRGGTNDSDIFIRGAVLSDNIIEKGKKRKKEKPAINIKNATIEYDADGITNAPSYASSYSIIPGSWQEM